MQSLKIITLGCGMMGKYMVQDQMQSRVWDRVYAADIVDRRAELESRGLDVGFLQRDLSDPKEVAKTVKDFDVIINALPGDSIGFNATQACLNLKRKIIVDIAFYEEDPSQFHRTAEENLNRVVFDAGVMPGLGGIQAIHAESQMDTVEETRIYVCGLPHIRVWPDDYKAPFSIKSILDEYVRTVEYRENGEAKIRPALSGSELVTFPQVGTLEAFYTNGARSLMRTSKAKNLSEFTMRYLGHRELMEKFRAMNFFSDQPVNIDGIGIRPIEFTAKILESTWKGGNTKDFTILKVIVVGQKNERNVEYVYSLYDEHDQTANNSSMARTTGGTGNVIAELLAEEGQHIPHGVWAPEEFVQMNKNYFSRVRSGLERRGVKFTEEIR